MSLPTLQILSKRRSSLLPSQISRCVVLRSAASIVGGEPFCRFNDRLRSFTTQSESSRSSLEPPPPPPTDEEISRQGLPLLRQVVSHAHADRPFLTEYPEWQDPKNPIVTYGTVGRKAVAVATMLRQLPAENSSSKFVAQSLLPGSDYVACQWGIFAAAKASVPLAISHKTAELQHVLEDSNPSTILVSPKVPNYKEVLQATTNLKMNDRIIFVEDEITSSVSDNIDPNELLHCSNSELNDR